MLGEEPGTGLGCRVGSRSLVGGEVVAVVAAGYAFFEGLAFGIPAEDLVDFLRHREAFLYDPTQPQTGVKYHDPPFRGNDSNAFLINQEPES